KRVEERISEVMANALRETKGDILVFLPGTGEIMRTTEKVSNFSSVRSGELAIHPLYGDLPFEEQQKAILPGRKRKVILATNIAETSLTIEGVQTVIDCGLARRLQYDTRTGMNRRLTVNISRASAEQRKGRAGRLGPGICYRLYSRYQFQSMVPYTPSEILTVDLSSLVLELAGWGVKNPGDLSWMDSPPKTAWEEAKHLLLGLGALDSEGNLTRGGRNMVPLPLHPRLSRMLIKANELGCLGLGVDLAALLSERDIIRPVAYFGGSYIKEKNIGDRLTLLQEWRKTKKVPAEADQWALSHVNRVAHELKDAVHRSAKKISEKGSTMIPCLLLHAYPDRVAKKRSEGVGRFLLSRGQGVRISEKDPLSQSPFIIAAQIESGQGAEGRVHLAEPVSEDLIRKALKPRIEEQRRVAWDKKEGRIVGALEERMGAVVLTEKPFNPSDEEASLILCEVIKSGSVPLTFTYGVRQLQGRVKLMRRIFPEEGWPNLSEEVLLAKPEDWLGPFLSGIRTREQLAGLDMLLPLRSMLTWEQKHLLETRTPVSLSVPSGRSVSLDYSNGDLPLLAVKLQEMFGLGDTPTLAEGRVKVLIHLLSPAGRPIQVTQDLRGFWNTGYSQVKKELKGRYPKHPWPDDPWTAPPTRKTKERKR
ncbi:MAG TPA: ATP-dependent helicase HrpB, partial [Thermodesulfobacteriota bacterium]|nr:ATP-dependent helicase HrpB [Thermodesulfobacteriota bacterium]